MTHSDGGYRPGGGTGGSRTLVAGRGLVRVPVLWGVYEVGERLVVGMLALVVSGLALVVPQLGLEPRIRRTAVSALRELPLRMSDEDGECTIIGEESSPGGKVWFACDEGTAANALTECTEEEFGTGGSSPFSWLWPRIRPRRWLASRRPSLPPPYASRPPAPPQSP